MSAAKPPLPQYTFMAYAELKKHRDNFTFTFKNRVVPVLLIKSHAMETY
jgi:hypothetical protein